MKPLILALLANEEGMKEIRAARGRITSAEEGSF